MAFRRDDELEYIDDDDFFDAESSGGRVLGGSGLRPPLDNELPPEEFPPPRNASPKPRPPKKSRNPSPTLPSEEERRARLAGNHIPNIKREPDSRPQPPKPGRLSKLRKRFSRSDSTEKSDPTPSQSHRASPFSLVGKGVGGLRSRLSRDESGEPPPQRPPRIPDRQSHAPRIESSGWLDLDRKLDILGVALVFGAILLTISALSAEQAAIGALHQLLGQLLGWGAVAVPVAIFAVGMWLIVRHFGDEPPTVDPLRVAGGALAFVGALVTLQYVDSLGYAALMPAIPACADATAPACIESLVQASYTDMRGGGLVGGWTYSALVNALTELGGLVATALLLTVGAMFITRSSASELAMAAVSLWRVAHTRVDQAITARRAQRMQRMMEEPQPHLEPLHIRKPQAPQLAGATMTDAAALPAPRSDWMPIPNRLRAMFSRRKPEVEQAVSQEVEPLPSAVPSMQEIATPQAFHAAPAQPPSFNHAPPISRPVPRTGRLERYLNMGDDLPAPPPVKSAPPASPAKPDLPPTPPPAPPRPTPEPVKIAELPASPAPARQGPKWKLPDYRELLDPGSAADLAQEPLVEQAKVIEETLAAFGAPGRVIEINSGPVITQYGVEPLYQTASNGKRSRVKVGDIAKLDKDLQLALGAKSVRMEAPVPGKGYVGIEVPNPLSARVSLRDVMDSDNYRKLDSPLALALGMAADGEPVAADLADMPHLLIAGATGAGKSVCVNAIINSILLRNSPDSVKFIMIDPKRVELTGYNGLPHMVAPVVVELERALGVLRWVTAEMEKRYQTLNRAGTRNISDYNRTLDPDLPPMAYIVVIIDELADLMMLVPKEVELIIRRIVQVARATGISMILATQRPSVDVVTGVIKANCPARIAFTVASGVDSRVILGTPGAERLLGKGDMLYASGDRPAPQRMQGVFVSEDEIRRISQFWKLQGAGVEAIDPIPPPQTKLPEAPLPPPTSDDGEQAAFWEMPAAESKRKAQDADDELYHTAVETVRRQNKASISLLQRKMRIGYGRAARLMDMMEERGVVGPAKEGSSKPRDVLPPG